MQTEGGRPMPIPTISDATSLQSDLMRLEMNSQNPPGETSSRTKLHSADKILGKESKLNKTVTTETREKGLWLKSQKRLTEPDYI